MVKKIIIFLIFSCSLFLSCAQKESKEIIHDSDASKLLLGSWNRTLITDSVLNTEIDALVVELGTVRNKTLTKNEFFDNQQFSLLNQQEFISFTPAANINIQDTNFTEEDLKQHFSQSIKITGTFKATKKLLELCYEKVIFPDGTEIPYEDYLLSNPQAGSKVQLVNWDIDNETLFLYSTESDISSQFTRN